MVKLSDGREIEYDLRNITLKEYKALFDPKQVDGEDYTILAKVTGMKPDEFEGLSLYDTKLIWQGFFKVTKEPLANPT
jgi:hypothetical protein